MKITDLKESDFLKYFSARLQDKRLRRSGSGWMALCCFHDEKTPSLSLNIEKGVFRCHGCGTQGGVLEFESKFSSCDKQTALKNIAEIIGQPQLFLSTGTAPEAIYSYVDANGKEIFQVVRNPGKRFTQRHKNDKGEWEYKTADIPMVPYRLDEVITSREICVCYSEDTEILTTDGWIPLPALRSDHVVANYCPATETIDFALPIAIQKFLYSGPMISVSSDWCSLLVTPDHRIAVKRSGIHGKTSITEAKKLRSRLSLPVSGFYSGGSGPSEIHARLMTAWQADGKQPKKGNLLCWDLKLERKKKRLRGLLTACGLTWEEKVHKGRPDFIRFLVNRHIANFLELWLPEKQWTWNTLQWSLESRLAILDELEHWDGSGRDTTGRQYHTSIKINADIVAAIAAISGRGCTTYCQNPKEGRWQKLTAYVCCLTFKQWRQFVKSPESVQYDGFVYCCTVPSGFVVTRRNHKITIAGNCEGEKDADNVRRVLKELYVKTGKPDSLITATTSPRGAGKWKDSFAPFFSGKKVVIFQDSDAPGKAHALQVANSVYRFANGVKIIECPEVKDVSDYLLTHTVQDLIQLVKATPTWKPAEVNHSLFMTISQFEETATEYVDWLVEGLIERGANGLFLGRPKSGKSPAALDLALAMASGQKWFDFFIPKRTRVALVSREDHANLTQRREKKMRIHRGLTEADLDGWLYINSKGLRPKIMLDYPEDVAALISDLKHYQSEFLILDVMRVMHGIDENDNTEMQKVIDTLNRIQDEAGCSICLLHHTNKDRDASLTESARGAGAIAGWGEFVLGVRVEDETEWVREFLCEIKADLPPERFFWKIMNTADGGTKLERVEWQAPTRGRKRSDVNSETPF